MKNIWKNLNLKYFRPDSMIDTWGDPKKIDPILLVKLEKLRERVKSPLIVTSGYRNDPSSQHYRGWAGDIMFPDYTDSLFDLWIQAERIGFSGIGIYPHWHYDGRMIGGLHVDCRSGDSARWLAYLNASGEQKYKRLNKVNLKKHGVI